MYTFCNVNIPNVTAGYERFSGSIAFFLGIFHIITTCLKTSSNFYKLYVKAKVWKWKGTLCKHLWLRQSSFFFIRWNKHFLNFLKFVKEVKSRPNMYINLWRSIWDLKLFSGSRKNSGNIDLLTSKPKFHWYFYSDIKQVRRYCIRIKKFLSDLMFFLKTPKCTWAFDGQCFTKVIILTNLIYMKPIFCHYFVENRWD